MQNLDKQKQHKQNLKEEPKKTAPKETGAAAAKAGEGERLVERLQKF